MSIAQKEREERTAYRRVLPSIIEALIEATEPVALSETVAEESGVDQRTAYRWIQLTEEAADKRRKRDAILLVVALWLGVLGAVAVAVGRLTTRFAFGIGPSVAVVAAAGLLIVAAALRLRNLKGRSYRRWLHDELADDRADDAK